MDAFTRVLLSSPEGHEIQPMDLEPGRPSAATLHGWGRERSLSGLEGRTRDLVPSFSKLTATDAGRTRPARAADRPCARGERGSPPRSPGARRPATGRPARRG